MRSNATRSGGQPLLVARPSRQEEEPSHGKANKGLMQEVGDKLMGRENETHGHAGSGTRNQPASTAGAGSVSNANHR